MSIVHGRLGVAVVGLGVGAQHAKAYLASGHSELRWVYDLDPVKATGVVAELGEGAVASSYEQILEDTSVHAVSIASYDDAHFGQVIAALNAGKHVFAEKPLCRTPDELSTTKETWSRQKGKLKLASNMVLRTAPLYRWLKEEIHDGGLGSIYAFDGDYLYGRLDKITLGWRKDVEGYSVMLGGGVHLVDLMLWLIGERPSSVAAVGNGISTEGTDFRYNDYVAATFYCPSGVIGRVTANFGCVHSHQHVVRVFGTGGTFISDDVGARLHATRGRSAAPTPIPHQATPSMKTDLIGPFVSAVLNDDDLDEHTQGLFDTISVCLASDAATRSSSVVTVDYV